MKIGILEIITLPSSNFGNKLYDPVVSKQMAAITPQAISVWCRQLGHKAYYSTYFGFGNIKRFLPNDLDLVFISSTTQQSPISYALSKLFRKSGTRTVFGGPHAKAFPMDCLRFFDLVVKECDKNLIKDIIDDQFKPGSYISSEKPYEEVPTVEERMPEIRASSYFFKKWRSFVNVIPMLTSVGCPYDCDFCVDWNKSYRLLSLDRLKVDLAFLSENFPRPAVSFYDSNFAFRFEKVFEVLEAVPRKRRIPYMMNLSQSILTPSRIERLKESNCRLLMLGVESWDAYSNKIGLGRNSDAKSKFDRTIENFQLLDGNDWFLGANFMFGLDSDCGEEPVTLTKDFIYQTPYSWPAVNIPSPFGGTPLQRQYHKEGRILEEMPFNFYSTPNLVIQLKNYDPLTYFEKMAEISSVISSDEMVKRRRKIAPSMTHILINQLRNIGQRQFTRYYQLMAEKIRTDRNFRDFHEGKAVPLPKYYHHEFEKQIGDYAPLLSQEDRYPNLEQMVPLSN
jgi:radical SAM superfamily enzyme YgiQ (UPF0313 family)